MAQEAGQSTADEQTLATAGQLLGTTKQTLNTAENCLAEEPNLHGEVADKEASYLNGIEAEELPANLDDATADSQELPAGSTELSAVSEELPSEKAELPAAASSDLPAVSSELPAASDLPAVSSGLPAVSLEIPAETRPLYENTSLPIQGFTGEQAPFALSAEPQTDGFSTRSPADDPLQRYRVPTVTDSQNITYPRESDSEPITLSAGEISIFKEGSYSVWMGKGGVELRQGKDTFRAEKLVLWVSNSESGDSSSSMAQDSSSPMARTALLYLEGKVQIAFVTSLTTSRIQSGSWSGRLQTTGEVQVSSAHQTSNGTKPQADPLYQAARRQLFQPAELMLTQFSTSSDGSFSVSSDSGVVVPSTQIQLNQPYTETASSTAETSDESMDTSSVPFLNPNQMHIQLSANGISKVKHGNKNVLICSKGVRIVISKSDALNHSITGIDKRYQKVLQQVNTIDITADRIVIWTNLQDDALQNLNGSVVSKDISMELYVEGNVVLKKDNDLRINADRMYFDVQTERGIIREAEVRANLPNFEGLIRLRAEEIRVPEEGLMVANNTFVTTSPMGKPTYRFQLDQLMLRNQNHPKVDPRTGRVMTDPRTGEELTEGTSNVTGRGAVVQAGEVPVFYLPYFSAPLKSPSSVINNVSVRSDSIFGVQPMIGVDAYRLFGLQNPPEGTSWDINALYYSKRGPGIGTVFEFDRNVKSFGTSFSGHHYGFMRFDGIYDSGTDNLGFGRYDLEPAHKWRYQAIGKQHFQFGNNLDFRVQIGIIGDRNYQQEYFQDSWYTESDRATQVELRQEIENLSWSVWADVRTNDFHTQTQRLPQAELYWIGQPIFGDLMTWSSYTQVGYTHLYPDTVPGDPNDAALWNLLPWEQNRSAARASTRHEISYPFQAGPVKLVPFALGEIAYWGEDLNGNSMTRLYGQAGVRASLPFWQFYNVTSELFNLKGIMHKVEFDVEASIAGADQSAYDLPLYDLLDDRSIMDFRHHMQNAVFNGQPIPSIYDIRSYAIRSNLGGWVTSPSTEMADDLLLIRFGMHHRWQTKRGNIGQERIIDWITFDMNFNLYPNCDRDNFGSAVGLLDYDFRWHPGDRLMLYSSGNFDFFTGGLKMVDIGAVLDRPEKGNLFTSLHFLSGPVDNVVLRLGYNYWMSAKWASTFEATLGLSGEGNLGERIALTRIGESFLFTSGVSYDGPSNNFGLFFTLEPRFGKKGNMARLFHISPPGTNGLD